MNDTFMKERPIFPLLVSMALPMVLSMTVNALYNIVDSFFVAQISEQAMTALSLVYPVQNMINAIAIGFGVGINALIALYSGAGDRCRADTAATHGLVFSILHGLIAAVVCIAMMPGFLRLFTGDEAVIALGVRYSSIAFFFAPVIMAELCFEKLFQAVGRMNETMAALLCGSITNIILDPVLIFGLGPFPMLGISGAALATAISPVLSIAICSRHFFQKDNTVQFVRQLPSAKLLGQSCQLGISGFVGEMSSGVTTTVFNFLLLGLAGNVAVAAYGVVANFALVATAIFNGVAQGAQPLVSRCYGHSDRAGARKLLILGSCTALALAAVLYAVVFGMTDTLVGWFNSENSAQMARFAHNGMRLYFVGYFFAGFNIVAAGYLSATNRPLEASVISICRGVAAIVVCSLVMSALFGMNGVWAAFPASELLTALLTLFLLLRKKKQTV